MWHDTIEPEVEVLQGAVELQRLKQPVHASSGSSPPRPDTSDQPAAALRTPNLLLSTPSCPTLEQVSADWKAWKLDHDVAGMVKRWAPNLSLVTVKGCGHTIPYSCPEKGFAFFENFLAEA